MIISHRAKMIFIHIQRTGGSSIINLLKGHLGEELEIIYQHGNARSAENHLLKDYPAYFTFAFVRNPWERLLSWYLLINKNSLTDLAGERIKFQNFLEMNNAFAPGDTHFHYNQLDYISNEEGQILTHKIYRFENYESEIEALQFDLDLPTKSAQIMNVSIEKNYRDFYTPKSQELIFEKCKKDINYFNYSF